MSDDVHMLSGAYAIHAIEDEVERRRFERHLTECEPCRAEVASLRETAALLADAVAVAPSAELRSRVLAQSVLTPQLPPFLAEPRAGREAGTRGLRPGGRRVSRPLVAVAAVVVLAGGALVGVSGVQLQRARQAERQAQSVLAILADPDARRATGAVAGGGSATVVVAGARAAVLTSDMAPLADDRIYQLWVVRPDAVLSAGLGPGGTEAGGRWSRIIDGVRQGDSVAISVEPAGGSAQPTTTPVTAVEV